MSSKSELKNKEKATRLRKAYCYNLTLFLLIIRRLSGCLHLD
jgi:hypothetical protein